jgi:hypothetical protein
MGVSMDEELDELDSSAISKSPQDVSAAVAIARLRININSFFISNNPLIYLSAKGRNKALLH